uniref:N-acetyllactosaminide beta-1,3-N-acetylglucosaminyltransferase n=1 Tax=Rhabditophanes sp. KR3021 TaxID=114890 RepID=A0AC35UEJ8_9BILA
MVFFLQILLILFKCVFSAVASEKVNGFNIFNKNYTYTTNILNTINTHSPDRITLVITCSSSYLKPKFEASITNWGGPMILGVLIDDNEIIGKQTACAYCTLKNMKGVNLKLSVHFIYKIRYPDYSEAELMKYLSLVDCKDESQVESICQMKKLSFKERVIKSSMFPINVLRNIARREVTTEFMILTDLDHVYSEHFESKMAALARKELKAGSKKVLVMRFFEVADSIKEPVKNKNELKKLMNAKLATEFHIKHYGVGHVIPKLPQWFKIEDSDVATVQFKQPYNVVEWEPQIVSRSDIPLHYDMPYPIHSHTSHRRELCRAGYKFLIVNDCFVYHRGFKSKEELKFVKAITNVHIKNKIFNKKNRAFEKRLDRIYPKTHNKCPRWTLLL